MCVCVSEIFTPRNWSLPFQEGLQLATNIINSILDLPTVYSTGQYWKVIRNTGNCVQRNPSGQHT